MLVKKIVQQRWNEIQQHTMIPKPTFLRMLDLCLVNCYFVFKEKFYLQIFGMPMGNGLSPIAVELVMDFVLTEVK